MPLRRCVTFVHEPTFLGPLLVPSLEMEPADKADIYYTRKELRNIRNDAKQLGQTVCRKQDPTNPLSYKNVMERSYDDCFKQGVPSMMDIEYLMHWTSACPMRRGLEKVCVPTMGAAKTKCVIDCRAAVLETQRRFNQEERVNTIRAVSESLSQPLINMARVHGIVDAAVARQEHDFCSRQHASYVIDLTLDEPCAKKVCRDMSGETSGLSCQQQQQNLAYL